MTVQADVLALSAFEHGKRLVSCKHLKLSDDIRGLDGGNGDGQYLELPTGGMQRYMKSEEMSFWSQNKLGRLLFQWTCDQKRNSVTSTLGVG